VAEMREKERESGGGSYNILGSKGTARAKLVVILIQGITGRVCIPEGPCDLLVLARALSLSMASIAPVAYLARYTIASPPTEFRKLIMALDIGMRN
jgi:hypothetical protein